MSRLGNEDQFKFLISCIRYSNNGKVDFGEVANECGIVSKGAAAKRYERMMKAHGIAPNAATIKPPRSVKREKDSSTKGSPSKKSKENSGDFTPKGSPVDDEERFSVFPPIKTETSNTDNPQDSRHVKEENDIFSSSMLDNEQLLQYMPQLEQSSIDSYARTGFEDNVNSSSFSSHTSTGFLSPLVSSQSSSAFPSSIPQNSGTIYSTSPPRHSISRFSSPLCQSSSHFDSPLNQRSGNLSSAFSNHPNQTVFSPSSNSTYDLTPSVSHPGAELSGELKIGRMQTPSTQNGFSDQNSIILD